MIHIVTINWTTDKWIDIQLNSFKKWIKESYKVYTRLGNMDEVTYRKHKDKYSCCIPGNVGESSHVTDGYKAVLPVVKENLSKDDLIMFIDSDAFLIGDISKLSDKINTFPFMAVVDGNHETNPNLLTPHPMFYLFKAEYFLESNLDSYAKKKIGDPAGNWWGSILLWLKENNLNYHPLHRTNKVNLHPLYFAIYEDIIYHHWAGSRKMITAADRRRHANTGELLESIAEENHILSDKVYGNINTQLENFMDYLLGKTQLTI
tara:strand:- start:217 stop:1002 length:786 start_codon:yes stop_codon:yes gene_type:complete